jgi:hypothetical protein
MSVGKPRIYRNDHVIFTDIDAGLTGIEGASLAWGDYDNNGYLDLAIGGLHSWTFAVTQLYRNDHGTFLDANAVLPGVAYASLAWGDYDNDGLLIWPWQGTILPALWQRSSAFMGLNRTRRRSRLLQVSVQTTMSLPVRSASHGAMAAICRASRRGFITISA